ncbi:MAG: adenosylcobinamide-phosphate synthase [Hydrogenophaga sp.]
MLAVSGDLSNAWDTLHPGAFGALAALVALAVDRLWGEPAARWHPVVWMGAYLGWAGQRIAPLANAAGTHQRRAFWRGALAWSVGALAVWLLSWMAVWLLAAAPGWLQVAVLGLLLKPMLAWRMLRDEVVAVEKALGESLAAGRARLAWLVSRDVERLDETQVRESAIETLAENLNDSVVAPLFWFAIAGLPGAALYRFANTADAMWGYRGEREGRDWTWAGKWAARADDVLSWLPARLTAGLIAGVCGAFRWRELRTQARQTPSPNSGWPMAAMALALDVRLSKPGVYQINASGRSPQAAHMARALRLSGRVVGLLVALAGFTAVAFAAAGITQGARP